MSKTYTGAGVLFRYPDDWFLAEERGEDDFTITVGDGETTQWSVTLMPGRPQPKEVLKQAVRAFREEYESLDVTESKVRLAGHSANAADLDFECFELLNAAFLRTFRTDRFTVLVMYQATGHELDALEPVFEDINGSLRCEEADGERD